LKLLVFCFCACLLVPSMAAARFVLELETAGEIGDTLSLPQAKVFGTVSVEEALNTRRSVRAFSKEEMSLEEISQLFWAAQGVTGASGPRKLRTAPSAGALYPLEVYAIWRGTLWHYLPELHAMEVRATKITQQGLAEASLGQEALREASACFVISGDYSVTAAKYGDRAQRYVHIEAGHVGQNILLQAVALGLAGVPMGAFKDEEVKAYLELPEGESPIYLLSFGHRKAE
jgi:SagB-type dehydrogenase family enzyme